MAKFKIGDIVTWETSSIKNNTIYERFHIVISDEDARKYYNGNIVIHTPESLRKEFKNVIFLADIENLFDIGWMPSDQIFKVTKAMKLLFMKDKYGKI